METALIKQNVVRDEDINPLFISLNALNESDAPGNDLQNFITELGRLPEAVTLDPDSSKFKLISNSLKPEVVVDYATKYYLNSRIPWFGTASVSQKLAANGTLTEASSTVDSQLDELAGIAAGLVTPLSNVKIAEIQKDSPPFIEGGAVSYRLKVTEIGFLYTFTRILCENSCNLSGLEAEPIKPDLVKGNYSRVPWPVTLAETKPKENKPTINVSGSIQLPGSDED